MFRVYSLDTKTFLYGLQLTLHIPPKPKHYKKCCLISTTYSSEIIKHMQVFEDTFAVHLPESATFLEYEDVGPQPFVFVGIFITFEPAENSIGVGRLYSLTHKNDFKIVKG
ncbi:hypothetical protein HHI36_002166, partial [Cryptolaemus montrouzieri]